jgi:SAM-dependent methyltransferase
MAADAAGTPAALRAAGVRAGSYDLVIGVFLLNYVDLAASAAILRAARRLVAPGGRVVFSVPHPSFPFFPRAPPPPAAAAAAAAAGDARYPFFFEVPPGGGYFSSRDVALPGRIWRLEPGAPALNVRAVHKTVEDYAALAEGAGDSRLTDALVDAADPAGDGAVDYEELVARLVREAEAAAAVVAAAEAAAAEAAAAASASKRRPSKPA